MYTAGTMNPLSGFPGMATGTPMYMTGSVVGNGTSNVPQQQMMMMPQQQQMMMMPQQQQMMMQPQQQMMMQPQQQMMMQPQQQMMMQPQQQQMMMQPQQQQMMMQPQQQMMMQPQQQPVLEAVIDPTSGFGNPRFYEQQEKIQKGLLVPSSQPGMLMSVVPQQQQMMMPQQQMMMPQQQQMMMPQQQQMMMPQQMMPPQQPRSSGGGDLESYLVSLAQQFLSSVGGSNATDFSINEADEDNSTALDLLTNNSSGPSSRDSISIEDLLLGSNSSSSNASSNEEESDDEDNSSFW
jgi:hypothetical protein